MKRILSVLLIAFLLLVPVLSAQADNGQYVYVDEGLLTADEIRTINDRAVEIAANRGVGIYYFYYGDVEDLSSFIMSFAKEHVVEENALVLGFSSDYRYFLQIGPIAEAALSDAVCEGPIMEAYRSVKGDPERKLLAYFNAADDALEAYFASGATVPAASGDSWSLADVPANIARTDGGKPTVIDRANLLTDSEAESLSKRLKEIGSAYKCDVVVATVPSLGLKTAEEYADDFFDYNGYGYGAIPDANGTTVDGDGILLLISTEARDFAVSTSGYGITAFTDYGVQEYLEPKFLSYLGNNDYAGGFNAYADGCAELLKMAREGMPYDYRRIYSESLTQDQLLLFNDRAESLCSTYNVGIYFLESEALTDADAFLENYIENRTFETNVIVLVNTPSGYSIRASGAVAQAKFSNKKLDSVKKAVEPHLDDSYAAVSAYMNVCEQIVSDYAHVLTGGTISEQTRKDFDLKLEQLYQEHGVALYFLYDAASGDPEALAREFLNSGTVFEGDAIVLGANASGCGAALRGECAREKFTDKRIAKLIKEINPQLSANNPEGAVNAFAERSEKILNWRPVNWLAVAVAIGIGLLFGFIPLAGMKRQLVSVQRRTDADEYLVPSTFTLTQNSDVLLGTNVSRSIHVQPTSSGGGGSRPSGGGGFHGGSSTHTSSSGGTHGGHSGKF